MAKIVEFIGPSGVGKSTTYQSLTNIWKKDNLWIPFHKCKFQTASLKKKLIFVSRSIILGHKSPIIDKNEAIRNFTYENREFIDNLWTAISKRKEHTDGKDHRYSAINWMMQQCGQYQVIKEYKKHALCVIEEGLFHNIGFAIDADPGSNDYHKVAKRNFQLLKPNIGAIINFDIQHDVLLKRLLERKRLSFLDKYSSNQQISERMKLSIEIIKEHLIILEKLNIPVLTIDANQNQHINAVKIKEFIDDLN